MNDNERTALVDELAEAMLPDYHGELATTAYMVRNAYRKQATACLPIIDRLLATRTAPDDDAVERAELAAEIEAAIHGSVIIANMDEDAPPTEVSAGTINNIAYSILPIIEREVALAAVPAVALAAVPAVDDDRIERAAEAMYDLNPDRDEWYDFPEYIAWHDTSEDSRCEYRDMARTALQAAAAAPVGIPRHESFIIATDANGVTRSTTTTATQGDATEQNGE